LTPHTRSEVLFEAKVTRRIAVLIALAVQATALAAPRKLAIVDLAAPPMMQGLGSLVTQSIVRQAQKDKQITVITPDQVKVTLGEKGVSAVRDCLGHADCVVERAGALNANQVVVGTFDRNEKSYLVKLWLIDLKSHRVVSTIDRSILIASRRLTTDVEEAIPDFLKGKAEEMGKLRITTNAKEATVFIDGEPSGRTPHDVDLKPGKHTVRLERKGYMAVERFATVEPDKVETLDVQMVAMPGFEEEVATEKPTAAKKPAETPGSEYHVPVVSWVLGGVAIAGAGVGGYFGSNSKSIQDKASPAAADGSLPITRAQAINGQNYAHYANYCFIGAGVVGLTGVILAIVLGSSTPAEKPVIAPGAAPAAGGAVLGVSGRF
jgi:hypothetical protein